MFTISIGHWIFLSCISWIFLSCISLFTSHKDKEYMFRNIIYFCNDQIWFYHIHPIIIRWYNLGGEIRKSSWNSYLNNLPKQNSFTICGKTAKFNLKLTFFSFLKKQKSSTWRVLQVWHICQLKCLFHKYMWISLHELLNRLTPRHATLYMH